jgi:O-antigen/teichoic acid export membrane protein
VLLSAQANAWFYMSWMIANFLFVVPGALTMVLHAINSAQQSALRYKARVTLGLSFAVGVAVNIVLLVAAPLVLSLFGHTYAQEASWTLRILALGAFPLIIKNHYISICRIHDRITQAMMGMAPGGLLELGLAILGAHLWGLAGLSAGWVGAMCIESLFMAPTVYRAVFAPLPASKSEGSPSLWENEVAASPRGMRPPAWEYNAAKSVRTQADSAAPIWSRDANAGQRSLRPIRLEPAPTPKTRF